jgi:hypothetical protein
MRSVQEAGRIGLNIVNKGKIFATPFFSGITGAAIVEQKWQAAGVSATIAGAFFVADKISNVKRKFEIGAYSFESGRYYQVLEDRAHQLLIYADRNHLPIYTSLDGRLTLSTTPTELRQLSISVGMDPTVKSETTAILKKINPEKLSMEETEYLRRLEAAIVFVPTIGMLFVNGDIRESDVHAAVSVCEEHYKTKHTVGKLPRTVIQDYFRPTGIHYQEVERG